MRVAAAVVGIAAAAGPPAHKATLDSEQQLPLTFNQGVARVSDGWILSGTNSPLPNTDVLVRTNEQLVPTVTKPNAIPQAWRDKGYDHIGDIDVVGDVIYAPFEQPNYELGHQATARYDANTLAFIDAVELPQHENSFVAVDPATMTAWSQDHFDGNTLFRYDIKAGWKPLPPLQMNLTLHHTQGAAMRGSDAIWISTSDPDNHLYLVDTATGAVETVGTLGHPGGEGEGMDATLVAADSIHTLVIDKNLSPVWLGHWRVGTETTVTPSPAPAGAGAPSTKGGSTASTGWYGGIALAVALAAAGFAYALMVRRRRSDLATGEGHQSLLG